VKVILLIMTTVRNSFKYTATGILGVKRRSMLENELLLRVAALVFYVCTIVCVKFVHRFTTKEQVRMFSTMDNV